jgi:hypothetical protein
MFALLSNVYRCARPSIWPPVTRPFSCFDPLRKAPARSAEEEAAQRLKLNDYRKKYNRHPDRREAHKLHARKYWEENREKYKARDARARAEDIRRRRTINLFVILQRGGADKYTWKTHTPIRYPDRVDHYCTGCSRERFLNTWWKEKLGRPESSEQSGPDRYMCNNCFANDWPRVVPETYTGRLPPIFMSPDLPLSKAQEQELAKEKEIESDKPQK